MEKIYQLGYALENLNIGLFLHDALENNDSFNSRISDRIQEKIVNQISDKKLILIGDFFHIKASINASQIGLIEFPTYFSIIEEETAKAVTLKSHLQGKIQQEGDQTIQMAQIYELAYLKTANIIAYGCLSAALIMNENQNQKNLDLAYQAGFNLGLALQIQTDVTRFVTEWTNNIKKILKVQEGSIYKWGINMPNYFLGQCLKNNTNVHEIYHQVLKNCDQHIQQNLEKSEKNFEEMGSNFYRMKKLQDHFLICN